VPILATDSSLLWLLPSVIMMYRSLRQTPLIVAIFGWLKDTGLWNRELPSGEFRFWE
jgi:hypothetical protein